MEGHLGAGVYVRTLSMKCSLAVLGTSSHTIFITTLVYLPHRERAKLGCVLIMCWARRAAILMQGTQL